MENPLKLTLGGTGTVTPATADDATVPATVTYHGDGTATVDHPLGRNHENARLTVARLRAKGIRIVSGPVPRPAPP